MLDTKVQLKGVNPYGEVTGGWIKLRAPMVRLILLEGWDPPSEGLPYDNNPKVRTAMGAPEGVYSRFDFDFTGPGAAQEARAIVQNLKDVEIFALVLLRTNVTPKGEAKKDTSCYHCLIVRKVNQGEDMQRLGFVHLDAEDLGGPLIVQENLPIITLV